MTESGTTPPPRRDATPVPGRGRREAAHDDGSLRSSDWQPVPIGTGMPRLLIEFDSVAQGIGLSPPDGDVLGPVDDGLPKGVVRGESHTAKLPKIVSNAAPLPSVVVRGDDGAAAGLDMPTEPAPPPTFSTLVIPPSATELSDSREDFVVGGPEPADWVRLPSDPRSAPTQPSIRRRSRSESPISPDAPTPVEPSAERRRDRTRRVVALSIGMVVALVGFSSLLAKRLFDAPTPVLAAAPAIEAARAAAVPVEAPRLAPGPAPRAVVEPMEPLGQAVPPAPSVDPRQAERESPAKDAVEPKPAAPELQRSRPVRVQSAIAQPGAAVPASSPPSSRRIWAPSSSSQPKKRLWFPPE